MKRLVLVKFFKGYIFREPFLGNRFLGGRELLKLLVCIDLRMLKFLCSWKITFTSKSNLNNGQRFSEAKINQSFIITFSENFVYLRVRLLLSNLFYSGILWVGGLDILFANFPKVLCCIGIFLTVFLLVEEVILLDNITRTIHYGIKKIQVLFT